MLTVPMLLLALAPVAPEAAPATPPLTGRVVDAGDRPLGGVEVLLSGIGAADGSRPVLARTKSDDAGRFRLEVPARAQAAGRQWAVWAHRPGMAVASRGFNLVEWPAEGSITLKLGPPSGARIRVVGPDGRPAAGAHVSPVTLRIEGGLPPTSGFPVPDELAARLVAETDAEGQGRIAGIDEGDLQAVAVEPPGAGRQVASPASDEGRGMKITLAPAGRIAGRVTAHDAAAVRGLKVRILTQGAADRRAGAVGQALATTDAAGRFDVPAIATGTLHASVLTPEGSGLRARPVLGLAVEPGRLTELVISLQGPARVRPVVGRVVDRRGEPVAGAVVFQAGDAPARSRTEADAQGRFSLPGVAGGRAFLFARKEGFRFQGQPIGPEPGEVTLTLTRADEAPTRAMRTLPPPLPHDQERALARRALGPYAEKVLEKGDEAEQVRLLEALARVEPARVLELTEGDKLSHPFLKVMIHRRVASGLLDDAPDEALAVFEAIADPSARAMGLLEVADALPETERARKLELLDRALVTARVAQEPTGIRVLLLGQVAERWLDLGRADRGEPLLREVQKEAEQLPTVAWAGYARGAFAEELAQVDAKAALELTKDLSDPREFDRHHGNIAHELAGRDPAEAERVLAMVRDALQRDQYAVRIISRMARVDRDRAHRLALGIRNAPLKGFGLGLMALGLAGSDRPAAEGLLREAYDTLDGATESDEPGGRFDDPAAVGAALLPVAERIDPHLVPESLWRSLALRPPIASGDPNATLDAQLAAMIARYDRELARDLLEPLAGPEVTALQVGNRGTIPAAAAAIDPRWAVEQIEAMPEAPDLKLHHPKNAARLAAAHILSRRDERRWRYFQYQYLHLWVPDIEDMAPDL